MSQSTIKRNFSFEKKILGKVSNIEQSQIEIATLVHQKPWLQFYLHTTVPVNEHNEMVAEGAPDFHHYEAVFVPYFFRVDPRKMTAELQAAIGAAQTRLGDVRRLTEKTMAVSLDKSNAITKSDLADPKLLIDVAGELREAERNELLALVMTDDNGNTLWDYENENGEAVNLTRDLLESNYFLEDAILAGLNEWKNPTRASQEATGKKKVKEADTTGETTTPTPKVSSSASPSGSTEASPTTKDSLGK